MRIFLSIAILLVTLPSCAQERKLPYWQDLRVIEVNKEYPRTTFMSYDARPDALSFDYARSRYYQLLNGTWKFYYVDAYRSLPEGITDPNVDASGWNDIKVPGNWELQGYGYPVYVNQPYEWAPRNPLAPNLPEETPVGVYRREIDIPAGWMGRTIYLHVAAAKSGLYVYVNGHEVGYSEDSKDPAEFDITPYVQAGKNTLVLKIYRWSTGSWLECQDFFRVSGIERDVFLWSQPRRAIRDFRVVSTLDDSYTDGIFRLYLNPTNKGTEDKEVTIHYLLSDAEGKRVATESRTVGLPGGGDASVSFEHTVKNVAPWSSETPNLYTLTMSVEEDGKITEIIPFKVGFRRIEIKETDITVNEKKLRLFFVNGQPIKLKGTNIHETTENGHYLTPEQLRRNFEIMKLNNINAVRLSHYPQDRKFYEMCSEYGLYVYDEANIESHGYGYTIYQDDMRKGTVGHVDGGKRGTLGHNPDYQGSHISRVRNMFERNKNYPSVTIWSLGNEGGNGFNFYVAYTYLKETDKDLMARPVCYERALEDWNTDMVVPQYPSAGSFRNYGQNGRGNRNSDNRPYVPSEYSHAMGNSSGNLHDQWKEIYKYPNLQGGFIWEWIDHALKTTTADGRVIWAYGGDFGKDLPSDGNFVADGIVNPDQTPHPAMAEVKYTHQNVGFEAVDLERGEVKITNRFYFTNLSKYTITYRLLENGKKIREGKLPLELAPQESTVVTLPVSKLKAKPGTLYLANFEVTTRSPEPLVPAGHVIAYDQFELPVHAPKPAYKDPGGPRLVVDEAGNLITIHSPKVNVTFDKQQGILTSYRVDGQEYFAGGFGIQPNFWRGPTDNDYGSQAPLRLQVWKESSKNFKITRAAASVEEGVALLEVVYALPTGNEYIMQYKIYPSGVLHAGVTFTLTKEEAQEVGLSDAMKEATQSDSGTRDRQRARQRELEMFRVGVRFRLPETMNQVQYLGRGPEENYLDRKAGTLVGLYASTAEELYFPYVRPQENGHHTDTRWVALNEANGKGIVIEADSIIGFNALRNPIEDFDSEESDADYQWPNMSPREVANKDLAHAKNRLRKHTHASDITPRPFVEVCIDMRQCGVAGYNSWGARPEAGYNILANREYRWGFTIIPTNKPEDAARKVGRAY
ncbi:MAG: DUF4981 domain-containing protein [Odoribacteraceae bacterium]|jgi:beta-galactosidase|nr:DUF4981 domain-containing protein [Odoribacteraceae bacterium]